MSPQPSGSERPTPDFRTSAHSQNDSRKERFQLFFERHGRQPFTPDFNSSLDAVMLDENNTIAERVLAWAKRRAWGNYSDWAADENLRPLGQTDCATELSLSKQLVNNAVRVWESRGYLRTEGRLICPVDAPEPKDLRDAQTPSFRAFLETWAVHHPDEYQEFETARDRLKAIHTRILQDFRTSKAPAATAKNAPESHPEPQPKVTIRLDKKSLYGLTKTAAYKERSLEVIEGRKEDETPSSSSSSVPFAVNPGMAAAATTTPSTLQSEIVRIFVEAGKDNPTPKQLRNAIAALPQHPDAAPHFLETLASKISRIKHPGALMSVVDGFAARWPAIQEIAERLSSPASGPASTSAEEEMAAFLTRCAGMLDQAGFDEIAFDLRTMARSELDPGAVEARLEELGSQMASVARSRADLAQIAADVDQDPAMAGYKRRMSPQQYGGLRDQAIDRRLRESLQLPALSLFYLR